MNSFENLESILNATVDVDIFRTLEVNNSLTVREPIGWYREEHLSMNTALFVHFLEQNNLKFQCCKNSKSKIEIAYTNDGDEQFMREKEDDLKRAIKYILDQTKPRDNAEKLILYTRLWRGYMKLTGHCFTCSLDISSEDEFTCNLCLTDNIILHEAMHYDGFWNNIGGYTFFSDPLPTLTTQNVMEENDENFEYMKSILGCKKNCGMSYCPFSLYMRKEDEEEGRKIITWHSMTVPRHYFFSQNFIQCANHQTKAVPPLSMLCCKEILHNVQNFRCKSLPLPPQLILKLEDVCKIITERDGCTGKRVFCSWIMTSCRMFNIIGNFKTEENSCPIQ